MNLNPKTLNDGLREPRKEDQLAQRPRFLSLESFRHKPLLHPQARITPVRSVIRGKGTWWVKGACELIWQRERLKNKLQKCSVSCGSASPRGVPPSCISAAREEVMGKPSPRDTINKQRSLLPDLSLSVLTQPGFKYHPEAWGLPSLDPHPRSLP